MNPLSDSLVQQTLTGIFRLVVPEIALVTTACIHFLLGCVYNRRSLWCGVSLIGVAIAAVVAATVTIDSPPVPTAASLLPDATATFVRWLALGSAAVLLLLTWPEVSDSIAAEYYGCLLILTAGVSLVGQANDLVTLFLALELISIPTYVLLYLPGRNRLNQEAAAKYFLLSVMSSAVLLFGFSYLYGLTGSTNIRVITETLAKANAEVVSPLALLAMVLILAAIGFRITAVPFHFYAPDVYEGGPPGVIALLAVLPKVAGFLALARLLGLVGTETLLIPFDSYSLLPLLLWILALLTMTVGNALALLQDNLRRMLAYSGVAHSGYMLMGLIVASSIHQASNRAELAIGGIEALLVYLVAYAMMTLGAFAIILYLSTPDHPIEAIDDLAGLGQSHPVSAGIMGVFLLSLIGLPLTAGFIGKLLLFIGAFTAPVDTPAMASLYRWMAVAAAVNAAIGAYYYLRVVGVMYLRTPLRPLMPSSSPATRAAAVLLAVGTLFLGVYPQPLVKAAREAAPIPSVHADRQ